MHDPGDTNGSLIEYLYGNASQISMPISVSKGSGLDLYNYPLVIRFLSLVHSVDPVNLRVELVRPLPFDINTQWLNLTLHKWQPTVQNVCRAWEEGGHIPVRGAVLSGAQSCQGKCVGATHMHCV